MFFVGTKGLEGPLTDSINAAMPIMTVRSPQMQTDGENQRRRRIGLLRQGSDPFHRQKGQETKEFLGKNLKYILLPYLVSDVYAFDINAFLTFTHFDVYECALSVLMVSTILFQCTMFEIV